MAKYRIKIEALDGDEKLDRECIDGMECDAFCIMTNTEDNSSVGLHNINIDTVARIMMQNTDLLAAGVLAKARKDAIDICRKGKMDKMLSDMFGM